MYLYNLLFIVERIIICDRNSFLNWKIVSEKEIRGMAIHTYFRDDRDTEQSVDTIDTFCPPYICVRGCPMLQRQKSATLYFLPKRDWPNHPFDFSLDKYKPVPLMESTWIFHLLLPSWPEPVCRPRNPLKLHKRLKICQM